MSGVQGVTWSQFDDDPDTQWWIEHAAAGDDDRNARVVASAILATKPAPPRALQVGDVLRSRHKVIGLSESPRGWVATLWWGDVVDTHSQRFNPNGLRLADGTLAVWPEGGAT